MNEHKSWDPSLVKKFSSSNHFKLINQLRVEIKKYPLIKKKNILLNNIKDNKVITKVNSDTLTKQDNLSTQKSNDNKDTVTKNSTISFNNSKNFSIYNNNRDSTKEKYEPIILNETEEINSSTFIDRLNKIDMK